jgi:hypothetical protein
MRVLRVNIKAISCVKLYIFTVLRFCCAIGTGLSAHRHVARSRTCFCATSQALPTPMSPWVSGSRNGAIRCCLSACASYDVLRRPNGWDPRRRSVVSGWQAPILNASERGDVAVCGSPTSKLGVRRLSTGHKPLTPVILSGWFPDCSISRSALACVSCVALHCIGMRTATRV